MYSWNSYNEFFFKILNNLCVVHIVANMFQTPIVGSMDCPIHSFILGEMKNSLELQVVDDIIWKTMRSSLPISSKISSSFKVEVKLSLFEKKPFEELEVNIFQVLNENKKKFIKMISSLHTCHENPNLQVSYLPLLGSN